MDLLGETTTLWEAIDGLSNRQCAFRLFARCATYAVAMPLMRSCGHSEAWRLWDRSLRHFGQPCTVGSGVHDDAWEQMSLPMSLGGFDLRLTTRHAPLAYLSCYSTVLPGSPLLQQASSPAPRLTLNLDTQVARDLDLSSVRISAAPVRQKELSRRADLAVFEGMQQDANAADKVRFGSLQQSLTSLWLLAILVGNQEWTTLCRLRLGLPIMEEPATCPGCRIAGRADIFGEHVATCMAGGLKGELHNSVVSEIDTIASEAAIFPRREFPPFSGVHAGRRVDIFIPSFSNGRDTLVDVATTYPMQFRNLPPAVIDTTSAPGGAATAYEAVKYTSYEQCLDHQRQKLVPFVVDSLGAFGRAARSFTSSLAFTWGTRRNVSTSIAVQRTFTRIAVVFHSRLAAILCRAQGHSAPHSASDAALAHHGGVSRTSGGG